MAPIPLPSPSSSLRGLIGHVFTSTSPLRKRLLVRLTSLPPFTRPLSTAPFSSLSLPLLPSQFTSALSRRQTIAILPTSYQVNGPSPGAIVGIVLGSVAGFILLILLLWSLSGGGIFASNTSLSGEEEVVVRRSHSPRRSHRSRRSTSIREVREVTRSPRPTRVIVEEERIVREPPPRPSEIIVEEEHRVPGDDVVEVIEEHSDLPSPPRRRDSDRRRRRSSVYRLVDPNLYAGGNYPQHSIPKRRDSFSDRS